MQIIQITKHFQVQYQLKIKKAKPKLLSEQEYLDQTQVETSRALKELREFCKSPKCDAWKLTSRLASPSRFAEFVAGKLLCKLFLNFFFHFKHSTKSLLSMEIVPTIFEF